jgi:predicted membrane-bound mannosyltransferase
LRFHLTYEQIFWIALFALAIFSRFWDLGDRGIHHDESLHAHFSDVLYSGGGYIHDPMMHGPLQFHLIAFMYWLFGATDATARFASVFCGIWVVMSPFFLRRQMGRIPAMVCAFLLLISPSILYFSRMAREDAIFSGMEMIMLVGLWRFVSMRKPADFILFCAGLSLMFTIKETSFLTLAIVAIFFFALFAYQAGYAVLAAFGGWLVASGGLFVFINSGMKTRSIPPLPNIPNQGPDYQTIMTFAKSFVTHPLFYGEVILFILFIAAVTVLMYRQRSTLSSSQAPTGLPTRMRLRPATAMAGADGGMGGAVAAGIPRRAARPSASISTTTVSPAPTNGNTDLQPEASVASVPDSVEIDAIQYTTDSDPFEAQEVWDPNKLEPKPGTALARYQPGSLPHLVGALFARPVIILVGLLIAFTIFITFYTVFFTDIPHGIVSGVFASLGYWMGQHDVQRGGQPWFYYLLLIPLYEPIAVFFSLAGATFFGWRGLRWLVRRRRGEDDEAEANTQSLGMFNTDRPVPFASFKAFLPLFLVWWLLGTVAIYSWAGEKMPWLMMHMVRPAIFLASLFVGALLLSLIRRRSERLAEAGALESTTLVASVPTLAAAPVKGNANGVPARRRTATATGPRIQQTAIMRTRVQDPPWVSWSSPSSRFPLLSFLTAFVVLVMAWGLLMNHLGSKSKYDAWGWTWVYPLMIVAMVVGYAVWLGAGRSLRYMGLGILTVGLMYQFRSAVNLAYNQPDVSTELASYVQTSPDVVRVMKEIETFSNYSTAGKTLKGGNDVKIMYDSDTSWPMEWYLRDYNKIFIGAGEAQPASDVPILLLDYEKHKNQANFLPNYVMQRYAMRWWFPQEWYMDEFLPNQFLRDAEGGFIYMKDDRGNPVNDKNGNPMRAQAPALNQVGEAMHTIGVTVTEPKLEATLWKYLIFREPPKSLGSTDMALYLRRDIAQLYHRLQYQPPNTTDLPGAGPLPPPDMTNERLYSLPDRTDLP